MFKGIVAVFVLVACCLLMASAQMSEQEAPAPDMAAQNWYHRRYYGYGYPYRYYGGYYPYGYGYGYPYYG